MLPACSSSSSQLLMLICMHCLNCNWGWDGQHPTLPNCNTLLSSITSTAKQLKAWHLMFLSFLGWM